MPCADSNATFDCGDALHPRTKQGGDKMASPIERERGPRRASRSRGPMIPTRPLGGCLRLGAARAGRAETSDPTRIPRRAWQDIPSDIPRRTSGRVAPAD